MLEERTAPLLESLRGNRGPGRPRQLSADPGNTPDAPLLFDLERGFGAAEPQRVPPDDSLILLRSAGERGEAEAIAAEVARLLAEGAEPEEIAIVVRDPGAPRPAARAGARVLRRRRSRSRPRCSVAAHGVGGSLLALLEASSAPAGRPTCCAGCGARPACRRVGSTGSSAGSGAPGTVTADGGARALGGARSASSPTTCVRAPRAPPARRHRRSRRSRSDDAGPDGDEDGPPPGRHRTEARAAAAISTALAEVAELEGLAPDPGWRCPGALGDSSSGSGIGPIERAGADRRPAARCGRRASTTSFDRLASGRRVPAQRRDRRRPLPLRVPAGVAGPAPRRETEAEERYLFYASPRTAAQERSSSPTATATRTGLPRLRSPFLDDVRRLLEPAPGEREPDPVEARIRGRGPGPGRAPAVADAPSETELARSIAASGAGAADARRCSSVAGVEGEIAARLGARLDAAAPRRGSQPGAGAARQPGGARRRWAMSPAYGGTTLEGFDVCSYRWFVDHELDPQPLDPVPDPLVQGGLVHAVLERALQGAARRRPASPGPARSTPGSTAAASWSPRSPPREIGERAGRAGDAARRRRPARALPRRGSATRRRRLRAVAARGRLRRGARRPSGRRSRSTAGACTARSTGSTARRGRPRPRPRLQGLRQGHPARKARGGGEAAAAALPDRRRRALGRRRRSAASTTRCAATTRAAAAGRCVLKEEAADLAASYGLVGAPTRLEER